MKRTTIKAPASLHVVPYTTTEWKKALAEVKREYTNRRFRQCASRCHEILDNIRSSVSPISTSCYTLSITCCVQTKTHTTQDVIEKAYIIFLHFYAASALEMQVRGLHSSSPHRSRFLVRARDHYRRASELAREEDDIIATRPMTSPSPSFSLHSPADSVSSRSTVSTRSSSPSREMQARETDIVPKPKKRVQFIEPPSSEPFIRPDSPTLGFDEWLGRSSPDLLIASDSDLLRHATEEPPMLSLRSEPALENDEENEDEQEKDEAQSESQDDPETDALGHTRSLHRYASILTGIRRQITTHLSAVEATIAASQAPSPPAPRDDEMRAMELRARVDRLRAEGWPRRKFDAQRYEALRENAAADMMM